MFNTTICQRTDNQFDNVIFIHSHYQPFLIHDKCQVSSQRLAEIPLTFNPVTSFFKAQNSSMCKIRIVSNLPLIALNYGTVGKLNRKQVTIKDTNILNSVALLYNSFSNLSCSQPQSMRVYPYALLTLLHEGLLAVKTSPSTYHIKRACCINMDSETTVLIKRVAD